MLNCSEPSTAASSKIFKFFADFTSSPNWCATFQLFIFLYYRIKKITCFHIHPPVLFLSVCHFGLSPKIQLAARKPGCFHYYKIKHSYAAKLLLRSTDNGLDKNKLFCIFWFQKIKITSFICLQYFPDIQCRITSFVPN